MHPVIIAEATPSMIVDDIHQIGTPTTLATPIRPTAPATTLIRLRILVVGWPYLSISSILLLRDD